MELGWGFLFSIPNQIGVLHIPEERFPYLVINPHHDQQRYVYSKLIVSLEIRIVASLILE